MTAQVPDTIVIEGLSEPLLRPLPLFAPDDPRRNVFRFHGESSANWRGYTACWLVENNHLYLTAVKGTLPPIKSGQDIAPASERQLIHVTLEDVYGTMEPVFADWVSGELQAWAGIRDDARPGGRVTYSHTRILQVERGVVVRRSIVKNDIPERKPVTGLLAKLRQASKSGEP